MTQDRNLPADSSSSTVHESSSNLTGSSRDSRASTGLVHRVAHRAIIERPRSWRNGQAVFNVLADRFPDLVEPLRGGSFDCFHNDDLIEPFVSEVERLYEKASIARIRERLVITEQGEIEKAKEIGQLASQRDRAEAERDELQAANVRFLAEIDAQAKWIAFLTSGESERQMADALGVADGRVWTLVGLQQVATTLRAERDALREKLESHAPEGHNCTNAQYNALRAENDSHKETIRRAVASSEALAKSNADLRALAAEMREALRELIRDASRWRFISPVVLERARAVLAKGEKA